MRSYLKIGRAVFGIAVAGALALGANQALAAPVTAASSEALCSTLECNELCVEMGFTRGFCPRYTDPDCICL